MKQFLRHAQLRAPGKKRREGGWQNFCRDHEHEPVGDGNKAAAYQNIGFAIGVIGAGELIAETECAAKVGGPWLFDDERVGTGFDDAALDVFSAKNSAEARRGFVKNEFSGAGAAMFFERECGGESGDATADDRDANHGTRLPVFGFRLPVSGCRRSASRFREYSCTRRARFF